MWHVDWTLFWAHLYAYPGVNSHFTSLFPFNPFAENVQSSNVYCFHLSMKQDKYSRALRSGQYTRSSLFPPSHLGRGLQLMVPVFPGQRPGKFFLCVFYHMAISGPIFFSVCISSPAPPRRTYLSMPSQPLSPFPPAQPRSRALVGALAPGEASQKGITCHCHCCRCRKWWMEGSSGDFNGEELK